jgi:hypothetical protein
MKRVPYGDNNVLLEEDEDNGDKREEWGSHPDAQFFLKIKQHIGISKSSNSGNGNSGLQQLHPLTSSLSRIIKQVAYCASKIWLNSQQNMFSKLNKWDFAGWCTCNLQWQDKIKVYGMVS